MKTILNIKNIFLQREGKIILNEVSWQINKGQHWAIIGRNGSGKTMTLKVITGYLWPTRGTAEVLGHKFGEYDLRELRKEIGWVSMDLQYEMNKPFPVLEVVLSGYFASIGLYDKPTKELKQKALHLMEFLECEKLADRKFHTLSFGEQKRVIIARALMTDPKLLILDEPCTGLDLVAREHFLEAVQKLGEKKDGPAIIYVTHHVEEIMPFVTHCHLIKDGKSFKQGRKEEMISSANLTDTLGLRIEVTKHNNRFWAKVGAEK